jgi:hypothetical protein
MARCLDQQHVKLHRPCLLCLPLPLALHQCQRAQHRDTQGPLAGPGPPQVPGLGEAARRAGGLAQHDSRVLRRMVFRVQPGGGFLVRQLLLAGAAGAAQQGFVWGLHNPTHVVTAVLCVVYCLCYDNLPAPDHARPDDTCMQCCDVPDRGIARITTARSSKSNDCCALSRRACLAAAGNA